ncbi:MAG TPA: DUF4386 domain-containing protein [Rhizomicrobium sp.]|jgi:hypothetical protein
MNKPWSPQYLARWIGILLLISLAFGSFGEMVVPAQLMVAGNAAATASNILHHQTLFRLSLAAYMVEGLCDATLTALLYLLLRPAGRELALIALLMRIVSTAAFSAAEFSYFAALPIVRGADYLKAFPAGQLNALAMLQIRLYGTSGSVPTLFYAVALILIGRLVFVSGYLPRWLGALLMLAGLSVTFEMFAIVVAPDYASDFLLLPMIVGMLALALWLLIRGVDELRWQERNSDPSMNAAPF